MQSENGSKIPKSGTSKTAVLRTGVFQNPANPGGYRYHHCADIQITADPAKPLDQGWPAEG
jgi:hypothetical protein